MLSFRCDGAAGTKDGRDLEFDGLAGLHQVLGVNSQSARDPVEPADRNSSRSRLQAADGLRGRGGSAAFCNVVEGHPTRAANFPDTRDHQSPL